MTARRIKSTAPLPSARVVDFDGLPIDLLDIELSTPSNGLASASAVVLLRPENGPPAAVLKVARGRLAAAELRAQRRVLAELAIHQDLGEWREMLPRILAFDERTDATLSMESYLPGIDLADALACNPGRVDELTAAALRAIAPLHRRTATPIVVDNVCLSRRWLVEPLNRLREMCWRMDPGLVPEMDRLGMLLRQATVGLHLSLCWTHGDYTPGNLRMSGMHGSVVGVVDWGGARSGQPALIDEYLMILAVRCQVQQADLGVVVAERLRAGGLSERERRVLRAARDRTDTVVADREHIREHIDECIDERAALILTWLHRITDLWRKRTTHPNHHAWWAANVAPVLEAVAVCDGFDAPTAYPPGG